MKPSILIIAAALIASPAMAQPAAPVRIQPVIATPGQATYVPHDKVDAALAHKTTPMLLTADNLQLEGSFRNKPGDVEMHKKQDDVFYVTDGEATFNVGGTYAGGREVADGNMVGGTITGGTAYHLVKGDSIVIPAGVPHQFTEVPKTISYFVVKVDR
jgi:mannose-6-phosphate isomerase-like protein (cupin superfamily)